MTNDATSLDSAVSQQIRLNNSMKEFGGIVNTAFDSMTPAIRDAINGTNSLGSSFKNLGIVAAKALEDMIIKLTIIKPLQAAITGGGTSLLSWLGIGSIPGAIGPTSVGGAPLVGLHSGGIVGSEATFSRYVHPTYFDNAPKFHTGGIAGDEVPIIAKRGEGVFTPGQMAAMGGGNSGPPIITNVTIDARGADAAAQARIAASLVKFQKDFERNVTSVMARYRNNNPGAR